MLSIEAHDSVQLARGTLSLFGSPLKACLYVVDGLMIDTGPRNLRRETIPFLQDVPVEQVALTHLHEDHVGLSAWLSKSKGAEVLIHRDAVAVAAKGSPLPWHRRLGWGNYVPFVSQPLPERIERDHHIFEVIPTPGHTDDHVVYYEKQKGWLFTGDLFVNPHPVQWDPGESAELYFESFERVLALDFDTVFCGHAGIIRKKGKEVMRKKLHYLLETRDKVAELFNKGYSLRQIDRTLFPEKPFSTYITGGKWSSYHLCASLLKSAQANKKKTNQA
jgi:glyoxylase-like metal-dependent hydrolase (beta-lactamase superfamily II)